MNAVPAPELSLGRILRAAALAGLAAGLLAGLFHLVLSEPVIDQAIAFEEQARPAAEPEPPLVGREVQRPGVVVGFAVYGASLGVVLGAVYVLVRRWLPGQRPARQVMVLALLGFWALGALPFLKYPANPPGVGDPETITYRQLVYLAALGAGIVGAALALVVGRAVAARASSVPLGWLGAAAVVVGVSLAVVVGLPPNPDPVTVPEELIRAFRGLSFSGLALFWTVLCGGFALFVGGPASA